MQLSVVIPTHNPDLGRLRRTLAALRVQTLPEAEWEILIVDNASAPALDPAAVAADAPARLRIVRETELGLTPARLRGFAETTGAIVVLVDDDNVLAPDYLAQALALAREQPRLGAWSGAIELEFEPGAVPPPAAWRSCLAERVVTADAVSGDREHHASTPWGAGMCLRREVCAAYAAELAGNPLRRRLDLQGGALLYGGDTDIAFVACQHGYTKGVFPRLRLTHLIPAHRCATAYLIRALEGHGYSSVIHEYILSGTIPPFLLDPVWRLRTAVKRLFLPPLERQTEAAHARGHARAVAHIRRLQAAP